MIERTFTMTDPQGLHARPASALVKIAKPFTADIKLVADKTVNLKNLMQVLSLGITPGTTFKVTAEGDDEAAALEAVAQALRDENMAE